MKTKSVIYVLCALLVIPALAAGDQQNPTPVAVLSQTGFEFEPVVDGTLVVHVFVVENAGDGVLSIRDVVTDCPCTTAEYPKKILPGKKGKITLKIDTSGYGGMIFSRDVLVSTNDPQKSVFYLHVKGKVNRFAKIEPRVIVLRGKAGDKIQSVVKITPEEKYPFTVTASFMDEALKGKMAFSLEKKNGVYILTAENLMANPGRYGGVVHLKTDSKIKPEMKIFAKGFIR